MAKIGIDARLWNETGIGRYIRNLVRGLDSEKYSNNRYIVFLLKKDYDAVEFKHPHIEKRLLDVKWHTLQEQVVIPNILTREKLDLVHFPYFSVPMFYKKPFVVTIHDLIIDHFSTGKASSLPFIAYHTKRYGYKMVLKNAINKSKHILTPSNATKKEIIDHYNASAEKITVTPEGVEKIFSYNKNDKSRPLPIKNKYFLYVGNVYPHKNAERLVDAFLRLGKEEAKMRLIFVGREDYFYRRLKKYTQDNNISNVDFMGHVTDAQLSKLYKKAAALVLPSLMEGFGLTVVEGMSMGVPVVCSDIPAFVEVGGTVPLYFDPNDTQDIADSLLRIVELSFQEKKKKELLGIKQAKKFSWEKMIQQTVTAYEDSTYI